MLIGCGMFLDRHGGLDPPSPAPPRGNVSHCAGVGYRGVVCWAGIPYREFNPSVIPGLDPGSPLRCCVVGATLAVALQKRSKELDFK
jgi:hypothetical protein